MNEKETNLDVVLKIASDIERLNYKEYLRLLSHALVQLSESAHDLDARVLAKAWEDRSADIDKLRKE